MSELSEGAAHLSQELRDGEDFGILDVYPGADAFASHARMWFSNAAGLCLECRSMQDFRVCGGVYGIRHGLELWLKGLVHAQRVAAAWTLMRREHSNFGSVAATAKLRTNQERATLRRALCGMRNVLQDKVFYPDCYRVRQEQVWAERAIELVRSGRAERFHFTSVWAPCFSDHRIMTLWREAKATLEMLHRAACIRAEQVGIGQPISVERLEAACELFAAIDPEGVAMRYPAALTGEWHTQKLTVCLKKLGRLAQQLDETVLAFENSEELRAYDDLY